MIVTIVTTSICGKRKKVSLLTHAWYHNRYLVHCYEVGQRVKTNQFAAFEVGSDKKGKIVGFNRPNCEGIRNDVLRVLLDGENHPRNLSTYEIMPDRDC